jgi:predicted DNA-binding transcriptional regulator YafY
MAHRYMKQNWLMEEHDKLAQRLGMILTKLNAGEHLQIASLAQEFNVSERTIQRDLNKRLSYLPLEREGQVYWLAPNYLGKNTISDIKRLVEFFGLSDVFPENNEQRLNELMKVLNRIYSIKGFASTDSAEAISHLHTLEQAIQAQRKVWLIHNDNTKTLLNPYRLVNFRGCWFLVGLKDERLCTYPLSQIVLIELSQQTYVLEPQFQQQIDQDESLWWSDLMEVVLKATPEIAINFKQRAILPEQEILKELEDGSLLLASRIYDYGQLLPLIKCWMPYLQIISPDHIHDRIVQDIQIMLDRITHGLGDGYRGDRHHKI